MSEKLCPQWNDLKENVSVPDINNEIADQVISQKIQNHATPGENKTLALRGNSSLFVSGNLGKLPKKKSVVFFNIVQKAFGPPPPFI